MIIIMKLTTVIGSTNNNPKYYKFIPSQIKFWKAFNIKFVAIFVGLSLPTELEEYKENILLWTKNEDINSVFVAQNIRMYSPALLDMPEDELVMITDMDMLPMNHTYYTSGLDTFTKDDFIYYRHVEGNQIYMCYNAAHPTTWGKVFGVSNEKDVETILNSTYIKTFDGRPGLSGWYTDQEIMYKHLINYPHLKVLNRPIIRLECSQFRSYLQNKRNIDVRKYDDFHAHRDYHSNIPLILTAEQQICN
jgi:hypothetical protein